MRDLANPKKGTSQERNEFVWGWIFILPTMIGLIVLNIYPIFKTIYESFFKTGDFGKGNIFIGAENYTKMFGDGEVWQALINTFKYAIVEVPFSIIISLVLAVLLNRKMKGRAVYRTIFFLPMVAAPAAIAMVWRWLFNAEFGLLNHILGTKTNWVSNPKIAIFAIAVIGICLKGQTLIQNKPSISEGCFSASLEKALFCGLSWILSLSMFCADF